MVALWAKGAVVKQQQKPKDASSGFLFCLGLGRLEQNRSCLAILLKLLRGRLQQVAHSVVDFIL
jgi:hypothetical protein